MRMKRYIPYVLGAALAGAFPLFAGAYLEQTVAAILIYLALAVSWDMLLRSGQLGFGTAGFFGLGATPQSSALNTNVHPFISIAFGGLVAGAVALLVGLAVLRLRGMYFAIMTLALAGIFAVVLRNFPRLTGGPEGKMLPNCIFSGDTTMIFWLALVLAVFAIVISEVFERTKNPPRAHVDPQRRASREVQRLGLPRVHHVGRRLRDQRLEVHAVDEVERVEHVALRLRHLLPVLVADDRVDVDVAERHVAREVGRRHDHARDPEEDDVEAGHEHGRRQERRELLRVVGPAQRRMAPQRRAEPRVQHVVVARERRGRAAEPRARGAARIGLVARDVDVAFLVVPRGNLVAPPQSRRDAPVLDVVDPVVVRRDPLAGHEAQVLARARRTGGQAGRRDGREAQVLDRLAGEERVRRRRRLLHVDEPLVRQHRLDDLARATAAGHDHRVRLFRHQEVRREEVGQHGLARDVAIESAVLRGRVVVDGGVEVEDRDRREPVAQPDLPVVEVVRGRDLHRARAELAVDVVVGDDRNRPASQRQRHVLADQRRVALVGRIDGDRDVAQHRLRPRRGDDHARAAVDEGIPDLPELALLLLAVDLEVRHGGAELGIPVDEPLAAVDEAVLVQADERLEHGGRQAVVHREPLARPVGRSAEAAHLLRDRGAGLFLPRPDALDERLASEVVARLAFGLQSLLDDDLRRDPRRGRCRPATACCRRASGGTGP